MQHQTMTRHKRLKMAHHNLFYVKMYSWGMFFAVCFLSVSLQVFFFLFFLFVCLFSFVVLSD